MNLATWRVVDSIRQQIPEYLRQPVRVKLHGQRVRCLEVERVLPRACRGQLHLLANGAHQVRSLGLELESVRGDT